MKRTPERHDQRRAQSEVGRARPVNIEFEVAVPRDALGAIETDAARTINDVSFDIDVVELVEIGLRFRLRRCAPVSYGPPGCGDQRACTTADDQFRF